jgi:uncharacterized protein YyaL (SSP411 family)
MAETVGSTAAPNRLIHETSPYLRQHAHNPVDWYPWGEEALARAKAEDKPILLSIGYSACHWCHVMAHECFENLDIAKLMNEQFINIKVDREERPDLDDIYQKSAQVFLGRGGGWPLTVFLTPDREPFYGGTYFPPVPRYHLPGFPQVLLGVVEVYRGHPDQVRQNIERVRNGLKRVGTPQPSSEPLTEALLDEAVKDLSLLYDSLHGGFGDGPKFPTVPPLSLLLRQSCRTGDLAYQEQVIHQLRRMAAGGIYDHLGGGFHRYAVDAQWLIPHFEKMLYDNAQLVRIYLDGWRLTREVRFKQVIEETLEYVRRELTHPDGGFYAAQDADSEGYEGRFFVWEPGEIQSILGPELGELFCRVYGVTAGGNFEGKSILNRLAGLNLNSEDQEELETILAPARRRLWEVRERRVKPQCDEKILTSWNGLMVSGLLDAYQTFGTPIYLDMAERSLAFLLERAWVNGRLHRTVTGGQARLNGYLDDYAFLAAALIDAYEATSQPGYLERAVELTEIMLEQFWDDETGGCFFTGRDHEALIQRMKSGTDAAMPSGNAVAATNLLRLFFYVGEPRYWDRAEQTLRVFRAQMDQNAYGSAALLCALDLFLAKPREIVLVGARTDPAAQALLRQIYGCYVPNKTLIVQVNARDGGPVRVPGAAAGKSAVNGKPTVYVCHGFTCSGPVTEWAELRPLLETKSGTER